MKASFLIIFLFSIVSVFSQDTLFLKSIQPFVANVIEVGDDFIIFKKPNNSIQKEKSLEFKMIKYKGGYVEKFNLNSNYIYGNLIKFINSKTINCDVLEITENEMVIDTYNSNGIKTISFDSVADVTYSNGYKEHYNNLLLQLAEDTEVLSTKKSADPISNIALNSLLNKITDTANQFISGTPSIIQEFTDAKGNLESIKALFDRVRQTQARWSSGARTATRSG